VLSGTDRDRRSRRVSAPLPLTPAASSSFAVDGLRFRHRDRRGSRFYASRPVEPDLHQADSIRPTPSNGSTNLLRSGRPAHNPAMLVRRAGDEVIVYDPKLESFHLLNSSAVVVWSMCDGATEPSTMVNEICDLAGLPPATVTADVERILSEFVDKNLLVWSD
jgi:Coenzyme PQQ synthesis protein D (PqqD)